MKTAIAGCNGMLARDLIPRLQRAGHSTVCFDLPELDITRHQETRAALAAVRPDLVINCAAYTAVDKAESEAEVAFAVNRDGTRNLAFICGELGIPFIHISTDYVFDGKSVRPYQEDDPTNPLGVYGQSKWEGEEAIRGCLEQHLIVRTSWLFGEHGNNFVKSMLRLAREREELRVVADQHGCPTWTGHLADALAAMAGAINTGSKDLPWGTYHLCGEGPTTWHDFACAIVEAARSRASLRVREILPITTAEYPTPARRPAWSVLDCTKIERALAIRPQPWGEGVEALVAGADWPSVVG
jgi:dTDP-4-dehydrorhamnose reductase